MSYLSSSPNCDEATVDYIMVKYEATNATASTGEYRLGTSIASGNQNP